MRLRLRLPDPGVEGGQGEGQVLGAGDAADHEVVPRGDPASSGYFYISFMIKVLSTYRQDTAEIKR